MSPVRIGVIGLGLMGSRWCRTVAEHGGAVLGLVSDLDSTLGRKIADLFGAEFAPDPMEAVARADIDGVVISTPEHLHVDLAMAAIGAGKVTAIEKPLAHTVRDAELIRDASNRGKVPVLACHILRFEPRYAAIRRAIEVGEIGAVQAIRSERIGLISDQDVLNGRTSIPLYYGVHEFDIARWYAGDVAKIWATRSSGVVLAHGHDVDDLYSVGLLFGNGAHGTAMVGWCLPTRSPGYGLAGFTVIGENGMLQVTQGATGFLKVLNDGPVDDDFHHSPEVHGHLFGAIGIEADHFVRCVRGETEPICNAVDGTEAVRVALAMERSADTGKVVEV